jgi:hypothetical protein
MEFESLKAATWGLKEASHFSGPSYFELSITGL